MRLTNKINTCRVDYIGRKFGILRILEFSHNVIIIDKRRYTTPYFICKCNCGNIKTISIRNLLGGNTISCGCQRIISAKLTHTTHGKKNHPLYYCWNGIKMRCKNKKDKRYKNYGSRGIGICKQWDNDFMVFYNWSIKNGWRKGLTIERKNVNKNYCPSNCTFISKNMQNNNKRNNVFITIKGEKLLVTEWARRLGIGSRIIYYRIEKGWDKAKAVLTPIRKQLSKKDVLSIINSTETTKDLSRRYNVSYQSIYQIKYRHAM